MSAFMLEGERIAQLADYISALHNMGFDYFGYFLYAGELRARTEEIHPVHAHYDYADQRLHRN